MDERIALCVHPEHFDSISIAARIYLVETVPKNAIDGDAGRNIAKTQNLHAYLFFFFLQLTDTTATSRPNLVFSHLVKIHQYGPVFHGGDFEINFALGIVPKCSLTDR